MGRLLHPKPRAEAWAAELTQSPPLQSTKLPSIHRHRRKQGPGCFPYLKEHGIHGPKAEFPQLMVPAHCPQPGSGLISVGLGWAGLGREESGAYTGDKL